MEEYRIEKDIGLCFVTFSVVVWLPVFIDESACKIVTDSFNFCIRNKQLAVNAFVVMPTHLHAIVFDVEFDSDRLKHTLDDMRKFTGLKLANHTAKYLPECFTSEFRRNAGEDRQRRPKVAVYAASCGDLRRTSSGGKRSNICIRIHAAKDWFCVPKIGDSRRPCFG